MTLFCLISRAAGYVTRPSGCVGGGGREATPYPDGKNWLHDFPENAITSSTGRQVRSGSFNVLYVFKNVLLGLHYHR